MELSYSPPSSSTRLAGALAAGLCTALMLGGIDALADGYGTASSLAAAERPMQAALRC